MKKNGLPRSLPPGFVLSADGRTARKVGSKPFGAAMPPPETLPLTVAEPTATKGKGKRRGEMNKTEREAYLILRTENPGALVLYEAVTFRVGALRYTADFMIVPPGGMPFFVETKGPWAYAKDIVRLKAAAALLPFVFILMQKHRGGEWQRTTIRGAANGEI